MNIKQYTALYKLKMLASEKLPVIAMQLIESGDESDALIELAWASSPTMADAGPLFEQGLRDLQIDIPDQATALSELTNLYCEQILSGEITPFRGAFDIWHNVCLDDEAPPAAFKFVGLADGIQNDGSPKNVQAFNNLIVKEAEKYVRGDNV